MMSENRNKKNRPIAWVEVKTFQEPHSGLAVVVKERIRGAHAYSLQVIHLEKDGHGNNFIPAFVGAIEELKTSESEIFMEDVLFSLIKAARTWISEQKKKENPKDEHKAKDRKAKDKKPRGPKKEPKTAGGLSALARKDAEAKGKGHDYKSPSERKKKKRQQAKEQAQG